MICHTRKALRPKTTGRTRVWTCSNIGPGLWAALAAILLLPSPAAAQADCTQWDVSGEWWVRQSGSHNAQFSLRQNGNTIQGSARSHQTGNPGASRQADVDGRLEGTKFDVTVYWSGESIGIYRGTIGPTGRIEGTTHDKRNPRNRAKWFSDTRMNCMARAGESSAPTLAQRDVSNVPVKPLGKRPPGQNAAACKSGFVWRLARPDDLVCVPPASRTRVAQENQAAPSRRQPGGGTTCRSGYVWREAFDGDVVCVTPQVRSLVAEENQLAPSRRVQ